MLGLKLNHVSKRGPWCANMFPRRQLILPRRWSKDCIINVNINSLQFYETLMLYYTLKHWDKMASILQATILNKFSLKILLCFDLVLTRYGFIAQYKSMIQLSLRMTFNQQTLNKCKYIALNISSHFLYGTNDNFL